MRSRRSVACHERGNEGKNTGERVADEGSQACQSVGSREGSSRKYPKEYELVGFEKLNVP
jgi:hypothetical protein